MGKISDALERRKKETSNKIKPLYETRELRTAPQEREVSIAKEVCTLHECSPKVVVLSAPESVDAENFRILRGQILFSRNRKRPKTIMVTSAFPSEGKSFVAANLAVSLAMGIDEYVLLIDCDLRRPHIHNTLGFNNAAGLHEYLSGQKQLKDLIIRTQIEKLSFLAAGRATSNPTELLSSIMMEEFLQEVKGRYDDRFVVIDSPPCQVSAETSVLATHVDGIILVVMAQRSPREAIKKSVRNLGKEKILGIVFNGYTNANRSYNKYYKKYYHSG